MANKNLAIIGGSLVTGGLILYYLYKKGILPPITPPTAPPVIPPPTPPVVPPKTATLYGSVLETRGGRTFGGLSDVKIMAVNRDTGYTVETYSDMKGDWRFENLPFGTYDLIARKSGYCPDYYYGQRIEAAGEFTIPPFALEKMTMEELKFESSKPIFSKEFTFPLPLYADKVEGYVTIDHFPFGLWETIDVWIYREGRKKRVIHDSMPPHFLPTPGHYAIKVSAKFSPQLVDKVSVWAGRGGLAGTQPILLKVDLMLKKTNPCVGR